MKNNNTFKEYVAPILVLVCICLVITAALAATYGVAKPIIDKNSLKAANEARAELLPDADSFTEYTGDLTVEEKDKVFVEDCYVADNGCGMVMTVKTKSFGGLLTMMVGLDDNGAVTGVKVTAHADTPGLGTKNFADGNKFLPQYEGLTELASTNVKQDTQVTPISGASVTSSAIHYGVYCALDQYKAMGGVQ